MKKKSGKIRFGLFIPPQHYPNQNPTRAIHRDLESVIYAESLGFTEAWIGEHHTGGSEIIGPSDLFVAAAIERTSRIRIGTGVASLPYHNPLEVAERAVFLDHLSYGRTMIGVGPGSLPSDAHQMGIKWSDTRRRMVESVEVIHELLTSEGTVTRETDWFTLKDAALQVGPYSEHLKFVFTAFESPFGPSLAGRFGGGLISLSSLLASGYASLEKHWEVLDKESTKHGHVADRSDWRVAVMIHIAQTREEAIRQVSPGLLRWADMLARASERTLEWFAPDPGALPPANAEEFAAFMASKKIVCIGTPDDAVKMIQGVVDATGGFGTLILHSGADWATQRDTYASWELLAREVFPHFDKSSAHLIRSENRVIATVEERRAEQRASINAARDAYTKANT
jgi:limonene 1,2-monooxygenase